VNDGRDKADCRCSGICPMVRNTQIVKLAFIETRKTVREKFLRLFCSAIANSRDFFSQKIHGGAAGTLRFKTETRDYSQTFSKLFFRQEKNQEFFPAFSCTNI
jgi:DNA gyrase inhibitor GyrI